MQQHRSESARFSHAVARRIIRKPQLGVERLESRAMLTFCWPVGMDWPYSFPGEADERELTAPVEDFAGDEPIWPAAEVSSVEGDEQEFTAPTEDGTDDEPIMEPEPVSEPQSEGDSGTPDSVEKRNWYCGIPNHPPTIGSIRYRVATWADGRSLDFFAMIYEGDEVEPVLADVLGRLRPGILGTEVTKVFVSIRDGQGGQLEYELDYSKSGEPESTVGDTPAEAPPVTAPDPIEPFATDTPGTASETDWTESDWSETEADWVEPETSLVESDHVAHEFVPELPAPDLTESFRQELLRNSLAFAPMSVVVRPTVVRFDTLSMRSPAAAYFAALAGLPSQVSEAASVTAVGAKRRGR